MTVETAYKEAKSSAMRSIASTVVSSKEIDAIEEVSNLAADELITDDLAQFGHREIAGVASRESYVPGNWINMSSEPTSIIWSVTKGAVTYDLRKELRARKAVLDRAINVRRALEKLVETDYHSRSANPVLSPSDAVAEFREFTEQETDYPDTVLREFHAGHAACDVEVAVFDNPLVEGEDSIAQVVEALETWLVSEYPEFCPDVLRENVASVEA